MTRSRRPAGAPLIGSRGLADLLTIDPAELRLAGAVNGAMWILGGMTQLVYPLLPGVVRVDHGLIAGLAVADLAWGAIVLGASRVRPTSLLVHLSTVLAVIAIAVAVSLTGGADSPGWIYFFWVALFAAYYFQRPVAFAYSAASVVGVTLPLVYGHHAMKHGFLDEVIVASVGILTVTYFVTAGKALLTRSRAQAERLAAEQAALRRVATAVVGDQEPEQIYTVAAREVAALLRADGGWIVQSRSEGDAIVLGAWSAAALVELKAGQIVPVQTGSGVGRALASRSGVRIDDLDPDAIARFVGCSSAVVFPIEHGDAVWGAAVVGSTRPGHFTVDAEQQLGAFCSLLSTTVANLEHRAKLAVEALTDPLTGLSNQRALHQRLAAELAGAARHGRMVSVAMLDIDHFKDINDTGGHTVGDEVLPQVAACLKAVARAQDTVGRFGGDEFMWILPDTDSAKARVAVERGRRLIGEALIAPLPVSASAGICDTAATRDSAELVRLADIALYASKSAGRNRLSVYDAGLAVALSPRSRADQLDREQVLAGLRALARAIDAKDPATREHSERVAAFAGRLAMAAGWSDERAALLREAALVHDVGKLAVPDALLSKPGCLTHRERVQMSEHAELSARIVGGVLTDEQVSWIGFHHERPDGQGYPLGVGGDAIPDGAALIALADAYDVMTVGRTYSARRSHGEAIDECTSLAGAQFSRAAVSALLALHARGELEQTEEPGLLAGLGR
jgi:diguanylate cyclase (GGDEF)-like protein